MASCEVEEIGLLAKRQFAIGIVSKSGNFPCENDDMRLGIESNVRIIVIRWTELQPTLDRSLLGRIFLNVSNVLMAWLRAERCVSVQGSLVS
jgi:hypothetical protein